jgi:hypothetical protein
MNTVEVIYWDDGQHFRCGPGYSGEALEEAVMCGGLNYHTIRLATELTDEEVAVVIREIVSPSTVDNGDGSGSFAPGVKLVGMGF